MESLKTLWGILVGSPCSFEEAQKSYIDNITELNKALERTQRIIDKHNKEREKTDGTIY